MPIHKWMAKAAGGTSQRLKRGPAMVRSLANNPGGFPCADTVSGTTVMNAPCDRYETTDIALATRMTVAEAEGGKWVSKKGGYCAKQHVNSLIAHCHILRQQTCAIFGSLTALKKPTHAQVRRETHLTEASAIQAHKGPG
jgi:hypothetical protein